MLNAPGTNNRKVICCAKITKPHGLHGVVKLRSLLSDNNLFEICNKFYYEDGNVANIVMVGGKDPNFLVTIENHTTLEQISRFVNCHLYMDTTLLPKIANDSYYFYQLQGLKVMFDGVQLGTIVAIHNFGCGDIMEVEGLQHMIPFSSTYIKEVSIDNGIVEICRLY